ncbi:hypothetical protein [Chryseobacterium koreense]|nr:hypothetical protein [Chryseobacterium koreense]MBB5333534.1 hypothetical protein [Chryseobacterium koreense]
MAKIINFNNFTGTINGIIYYTSNGHQFLRADPKKRTLTKSKALPKKTLAGIEALRINHALHSMNHLVKALKDEFQTLQTGMQPQQKNMPAAKEFQDASSGKQSGSALTNNSKSPAFANAVSDNTEIKFTVRGTKTDLCIIILQINFETGEFRRKKISLDEANCIRKNTYTIETAFQPRKGYTDLLFLYGQYFLKAVPIQIKDRNS